MDISSIVVPVVLAALSGLSYLAVKHPKTFDAMWGKLYGLAVVIASVLAAWSFGVHAAQSRIANLIPPANLAAATARIESIYISPSFVMIGLFAVCGVLLFLSWLSHSVRSQQTDSQDG